uniref:Reverse transcriptase zinc-binding domain-containing protein n=1 Tax=Tanacetum cinerariifolium TaxID=118510 RepID=A0A6L2JK31_TANCI|nr:hypothetical protein [Tanacetum cinerariifolium]
MVESLIKEGIGSDKGIQDETENGNGIADAVLEECSKKSDDGNNDNDKVNDDLNDVTTDKTKDVTIDKNNDNSKNGVENLNQSTYASKLNANNNNDGNKLFFVSTCTKTIGEEVVRLEEELVREGCEKWKYTICGYFVGCRMSVYELKYNIKRMWGRLGLKDIVVDADEICFLKFKSEEQMNLVLDQSLWLYNVPLEAWSIKGISTISTRLGMPVKIDHMTAEMCKGSGRLGYARVLVEIDASKQDAVIVGVFGHSLNNCKSMPKGTVEVEQGINHNEKGENNSKGFVEVRNRKNEMTNHGMNNQLQQWKNALPRNEQVNNNVKYTYKKKNQEIKQTVFAKKDKSKPETGKAGTNAGKVWKISKENANEINRSTNKYAVLSDEDNGSNESNMEDGFADKRLIKAMERKEAMDDEDSNEEDVYVNQNGAIHDITANENIEIDDICSSRFYYTWIKSLKNPSNSALNKLARIMCNDTFLSSYGNVHGMFLPFMISDHSPAVLVVPNVLNRKRKSFRSVNYVANKTEFLDTVKKDWEIEIKGCNMFKVVKIMRYLKKSLNDLNWKNGNLFDKNFLCKSTPVKPLSDLGDIAVKKLSMEVADKMIVEVTDKEIKKALFDIDNDLLILCNGDKDSLRVVKKALNEFSNVSGLLPNLNNSTIFFGSVNEGLKRELLHILPFKLGSLPMKYMGVLVATKLGVKDLVKNLDKLFKKFLWYSRDFAKGKARVAWNLVCRPEDQGALGPIKDIIPNRLVLEARFKGIETVKEGIINGRWDWPDEWGVLYPMLKQIVDKMMTWYKGDPLKCSLCKKEADSHKHLFFECQYAKKVWIHMQSKSTIEWKTSDLQNMVEKLSSKALGNKIYHIANRLIISSTVYQIWNERNKRNFQNSSRSPKELVGCIEGNIIDMLKSLNVKKSSNVKMVADILGIKIG